MLMKYLGEFSEVIFKVCERQDEYKINGSNCIIPENLWLTCTDSWEYKKNNLLIFHEKVIALPSVRRWSQIRTIKY